MHQFILESIVYHFPVIIHHYFEVAVPIQPIQFVINFHEIEKLFLIIMETKLIFAKQF